MIPKYYEFQNSTKILSGKRALENIPKELNMLNAKNVLILSDKTLEKIGIVKTVVDALYCSYINIKKIYCDIPTDSSLDIVNEIVKIYKENKCDSIIAIGGGSVIDTAKGVRMVLMQNVSNILELEGSEMINYGKNIPFVAIPTTSGTGSEATLVAVILDKLRNVKMEFISYFLLPNISVLDSRMTLSLPSKITAETGMDALCHAIEAYTCIQKNPLSDAYAISAIEILRENLVETVKNGNDKNKRLELANASLMAGIAFSNSMVGLIHAIGHSVGSVAHVPHGEAMAILMPQCMKFNLDKLEEEYGKLLLYIGGDEIYAKTPKNERGKMAIKVIEKLIKKLNEISKMPTRLREANVKKEQFLEIANKAINDGAIILNPKNANVSEIIKILEEAY